MNGNFEYLCYGLVAAWLIVVLYVMLLGMRESKLAKRARPRAADGGAARKVA